MAQRTLVVSCLLLAGLPGAGASDAPPACDEATCDPVAANDGAQKAGEEPVTYILFAHPRDILQLAPANLEPPGEGEPDVNDGFLIPTLYTDDEDAPCCKFRYNDFRWFVTPGPLGTGDDGSWRVPTVPGFAGPLRIAGDELVVFLYASPGTDEEPVGGPAIVPSVGVHARMDTGLFVGVNESRRVAEGDTGSGYGGFDAARAAAATTMIRLPGEDPVYEFRVPMRVVRDHVPGVHDGDPQASGLSVRLHLYQFEQEDAVRFTQSSWRIRSGPDFPARLVMDVIEPLRAVEARVVIDEESLEFRWSVVAAFGAYDFDLSSIRFRVEGPSVVEPELASLRYSVGPEGQFRPASITWRHDLAAKPLSNGTYHVTASAMNLQGTYRVAWDASFVVDEEGEPLVDSASGARLRGSADAPAVGVFVALAATLAVVAIGRRRTSS